MSSVFVAQELNRTMCPSCGPDVERRAADRGAPSSLKQGGQRGDSWRWSDAWADAFSLVLTRCVGSMTPVEDQYSLAGLPRAARFNFCLHMWHRVDGDPEWRSGGLGRPPISAAQGSSFMPAGSMRSLPSDAPTPIIGSKSSSRCRRAPSRARSTVAPPSRGSSSRAPAQTSGPSRSPSAITSSLRAKYWCSQLRWHSAADASRLAAPAAARPVRIGAVASSRRSRGEGELLVGRIPAVSSLLAPCRDRACRRRSRRRHARTRILDRTLTRAHTGMSGRNTATVVWHRTPPTATAAYDHGE